MPLLENTSGRASELSWEQMRRINAEAYSEPFQTFKIERFSEIVINHKSFTIFCKSLHLRLLAGFGIHICND